jgi:fibro-slime domain-containing protein
MNQCARFTLVMAAIFTFACSAGAPVGSSVRPSAGAGNTPSNGGTGNAPGGGTGNAAGLPDINIPISGAGGGDNGGSGGQSGKSCDGKLIGYIRDFLAEKNQDFEPWTVAGPAGPTGNGFPNRYMPLKVDPAATIGLPNTTCPNGRPCLELGIIQPTLDPVTLKPTYAKGDGSTSLTTTGQKNFDTWFRDDPAVNMGMPLPLQFTKDPTDPTGQTYVFDSTTSPLGGFFPIDNMMLSPTLPAEGFPHNFSFTFELHTKFTYNAGQKFNFKGDDDVWVFINNKLVVDLGGIHDIGTQNVDLDTLGLTAGASYPLDFFYAERHCCASNFVLSTSIAFTDCDIIVVK